jgi:hypothetical protein
MGVGASAAEGVAQFVIAWCSSPDASTGTPALEGKPILAET